MGSFIKWIICLVREIGKNLLHFSIFIPFGKQKTRTKTPKRSEVPTSKFYYLFLVYLKFAIFKSHTLPFGLLSILATNFNILPMEFLFVHSFYSTHLLAHLQMNDHLHDVFPLLIFPSMVESNSMEISHCRKQERKTKTQKFILKHKILFILANVVDFNFCSWRLV